MTVKLHPVAGKYLDRLPEPQKGKIMDALRGLEKEPPEGNIRPLTGQPGQWRLKAGGYRALYRIEENTVFVTHIDPRGQAYKKKNRGKR